MSQLLEILGTWSFRERQIPPSTPRNLEVPKELRPGVALVIQGVRRCGKSTLMTQLVQKYELDPVQYAFLNLEDPRLANMLTWETLNLMVTEFDQKIGGPGPQAP